MASSAATAWVNGSRKGWVRRASAAVVGADHRVERLAPGLGLHHHARRRRRRGCRRRCGGGRGSTGAGRGRVRRAGRSPAPCPAARGPSGARYSGKIETTSMRRSELVLSSPGWSSMTIRPPGDVDLGHQRRRRTGRAPRAPAYGSRAGPARRCARSGSSSPDDVARRWSPRAARRAGGRRTPRGPPAARRGSTATAELGAAGGLGGGAVGDLLEPDHQPTGVGPRCRRRSANRRSCRRTCAGGEAALRLVGARLHEDLTARARGRGPIRPTTTKSSTLTPRSTLRQVAPSSTREKVPLIW